MLKADNYTPTRVIFGVGRLKELATAELPGKKALICTTAGGSVKKPGILERVVELLKENATETVIYDRVKQNPTKEDVDEAVRLAKENQCDFLLGLGRGSSIDTAKAVAIMMESDGDLWDYAYTGTGGKKPIKVAAPVVAVSTTSGTGSETDQYSVNMKHASLACMLLYA